MPKYKPMLIDVDNDGYNYALKRAKEKVHLYNKALAWCQQHIDVTDCEGFSASFSHYFKQEYHLLNKDKIKLDIRIEKILDLMDISLFELERIEADYRSNDSPLQFNNGVPLPDIKIRDYEIYTKSSEENERLRDARKFIEALKRLSHHTKIYPLNIQGATSNLVRYDLRSNEYSVNLRGV